MPPPSTARGSAAAVLPLMFLLGLATSCAAPQRTADPRAEREAVLSAIDRLWHAYALKDIETQRLLYAEDAVQIGDRRAEGRTAILRYLNQWYRGREIQSWTHTQRDVKLMGDVALASYWDDETGLVDGVPYRVSCWVSDVWVRRDGRWHNLLSHFGANQALEPEPEP
jgi:ketosteroid isomerase-like protein